MRIIDKYVMFRQEWSLLRKACRNLFDEFGLWATRCPDLPPICIRMHLYAFICIRMHPYASIRFIYVPNGNIQYAFSLKKSKRQTIVEIDFSIMRSGA